MKIVILNTQRKKSLVQHIDKYNDHCDGYNHVAKYSLIFDHGWRLSFIENSCKFAGDFIKEHRETIK